MPAPHDRNAPALSPAPMPPRWAGDRIRWAAEYLARQGHHDVARELLVDHHQPVPDWVQAGCSTAHPWLYQRILDELGKPERAAGLGKVGLGRVLQQARHDVHMALHAMVDQGLVRGVWQPRLHKRPLMRYVRVKSAAPTEPRAEARDR